MSLSGPNSSMWAVWNCPPSDGENKGMGTDGISAELYELTEEQSNKHGNLDDKLLEKNRDWNVITWRSHRKKYSSFDDYRKAFVSVWHDIGQAYGW